MNKCKECNHKFSIAAKIKSLMHCCNTVKCSKCGAVYKRTSYVVPILTFIISLVAALYIYKKYLTGSFYLKEYVAYCFAAAILIVLQDVLNLVTFRIGKREKVDSSKY